MKLKKKCKILFQGDSITDAERNSTYNKLGEGYVYITNGWLLANFYMFDIECINRGISGNTIMDLKFRWQRDCLDLKPDIISILIGINDCSQNISDEVFMKTYEEILLVTIKNIKPVIVLMSPFILEISNYHKKLSKDVESKHKIVEELSKKYDTLFIPLYKIFKKLSIQRSPDYWAEDGIHPTPQGHYIIAKEFVRIITEK
ncbi:MAG: SGNH/GDSL hydrolase family protein [Endomicrobia bacterium]|nr:SGNH/GDSL hydrolase family protein [Endomicrobiia bacterium]